MVNWTNPKTSKESEYLSIDSIWFGGNHVEFHTSCDGLCAHIASDIW